MSVMSQLLGVLLIVLIGTSVSAGTVTSYSHLQKSLPQAMGLLSSLCRYLHTLCNMLGKKHHSPSLHTPLSLPTHTTPLPHHTDPHLSFFSAGQWGIIAASLIVTAVLEAYTWQIDNLILGLFQFAFFLSFL